MPSNQAAWFEASKAPLVVKPAPVPKPEPGRVIIRNAAVAVNPIDWKIQDLLSASLIKKFPFILGQDTAGVIEQVGPDVKGFSKGQRVIAQCSSLATQDPSISAFQLYSNVSTDIISVIPDTLAFKDAVVLPLAISTAATALYQDSHLGLPLPSIQDAKPAGKTILVWGASSSVGSMAVQLAHASGVDVVATASQHNHDFVKSLGVKTVLDYKSPTIIDDLVKVLKGGNLAGIVDSISHTDTFKSIAEIRKQLGSSVKVAGVLPLMEAIPDFTPTTVMATTIFHDPNEHIGAYIWGKFVPKTLESGKLKALPKSQVVGRGLESIQKGLDVQKQGVSASKVVIVLDD
ncbi:hypothetical protein CDD81_8108 [Ophiocordyceps australis]|uniref:Enoyl reductase (ER) domain-containing protein n=1 Tax=Ophiocordyceps australis TaxID=1399860 RepID=A0A2C5Y3W3_9HYPO|nr:hypothetical protein CDD81_8108 [Ophiocordyceps australis]